MRTQKDRAMHAIRNASDIGKTIRAERKAQGFTQTELAQACGVGLTFVSNLENGKETAEIGKALHVARMLGLDLFVAKRGE